MKSTDLIRRPSKMMRHAADALHLRKLPEHRYATGGLIALILLALGVYWLLPEIRRYSRIERM